MYAHRPEYYKFDQWFFLKMYEMGLAYKKMTQVNWCAHDQATLSNEQASGGLCWRCGNPVTKKDLEQWFLKTTAYTDQLLDDMAEIEAGWPQNVIKRQRDWIGRSEGAFVDFKRQSITSIAAKTAIEQTAVRVFHYAHRHDIRRECDRGCGGASGHYQAISSKFSEEVARKVAADPR